MSADRLGARDSWARPLMEPLCRARRSSRMLFLPGLRVSARVDGEEVTIRWEAVTGPPEGFPARPIKIVGYQVIVGAFQVTLPASGRRWRSRKNNVRSLRGAPRVRGPGDRGRREPDDHVGYVHDTVMLGRYLLGIRGLTASPCDPGPRHVATSSPDPCRHDRRASRGGVAAMAVPIIRAASTYDWFENVFVVLILRWHGSSARGDGGLGLPRLQSSPSEGPDGVQRV